MSVFSGVMAILSPNFVTRFLKESGRDVLSKLQAEYGVNCMRTSEDVCTVQGEWEAMLKVHSFLKQAENSTPVRAKGKGGMPSTQQRNGGLTSSLNNDHATDIQIVTNWGEGGAGLAQEDPANYSISNGPDALQSLGTVIQLVPSGGTPRPTSSRSLLANMPKLTYKGQAPPPPPPLQPIYRDPSTSYPDHETDIKPSILVDDSFMTNLQVTPPKKRKSPKAIAKKSTAKKAGTAAKELKKKLKAGTPEAAALAASLTPSPVPSGLPTMSVDPMPQIKTEPVDHDFSGETHDDSLSNMTDLSAEMPVLTKQLDGSPTLSITPTKQEGGLDCLKCKKVFAEHKELEVHMYVYHNPDCIGKEIQCPYCSKVFLSKNGLEEHMYNHVGTRPFSCHLCPVSFNHRKSLRRHLERHSTTRKFSCDQCNLTFMRKEALDSHRLIHQKDPSANANTNTRLSCTICDEKFENMASYRKHMQYDHYEINEAFNLGPTTHLEEVDAIEADEDVIDLFQDNNDDGDWRKPRKKGKPKAPKGKGVKRKANASADASKKNKNDGGIDTTSETLNDTSDAEASLAVEGENGGNTEHSLLDHSEADSPHTESKLGNTDHKDSGTAKDKEAKSNTESAENPSHDMPDPVHSPENDNLDSPKNKQTPESDKDAASPAASPASDSDSSSGDESSSSSSSKSDSN